MVDPQILALESAAKAARQPMLPILTEAGVAPSTWWRWRHGGKKPRISTLLRVRAALERHVEAVRLMYESVHVDPLHGADNNTFSDRAEVQTPTTRNGSKTVEKSGTCP